ncbi:hypothetical protein SAMN04487905_103362 [Actinopolyspora xinjiangensis]|uniref:Immunity protein Imm1 n=1 Tax=Actinopolyspora xinjiangensis TaxID=405564 RepID=A0A1H0S3A5_9ACTN|nr:Imm1 family immunity protein [Actinopolyspora xinjiangensis]SDP36222.1 hypothetical protein SAMN04487905_103362 [Actinopolyspora xinjiangensis]
MTIRAKHFELEPDSTVTENLRESTLVTDSEVETFLAELSDPNANEAILTHESRPMKQHPRTGRLAPDHSLKIAVAGGYGYAEYTGPGHWCQAVGDPASREYHTSRSHTMRAGNGLSFPTLTRLVTEFLETGELPQLVTWREQSDPSVAHPS